MIPKKTRAFTLIELMAVLVIIGIFSAAAIPGLMQVRYRNSLTETVANFRTAGALARDMALQTKRAVVLEVSNGSTWINLLESPDCGGPLLPDGLRCTSPLDPDKDGIPYFEPGSTAETAGVAMCGGVALAFAANGTVCGEEQLNLAVSGSNAFAICYSGGGDLFVRQEADSNTACGASADPSTTVEWKRPCNRPDAVDVNFAGGVSTQFLRDGAAVMFNRFDGAACNSQGDDVPRFVVFPTSGVPYTQRGAMP